MRWLIALSLVACGGGSSDPGPQLCEGGEPGFHFLIKTPKLDRDENILRVSASSGGFSMAELLPAQPVDGVVDLRVPYPEGLQAGPASVFFYTGSGPFEPEYFAAADVDVALDRCTPVRLDTQGLAPDAGTDPCQGRGPGVVAQLSVNCENGCPAAWEGPGRLGVDIGDLENPSVDVPASAIDSSGHADLFIGFPAGATDGEATVYFGAQWAGGNVQYQGVSLIQAKVDRCQTAPLSVGTVVYLDAGVP